MIFVSVGTHPQAFDRLLKKIDGLLESSGLKENVVAQIGVSRYMPKNYKSKDFFQDKELDSLLKKSSIIISHAGAGNIIRAMNFRKKIIVVPRLKKFGEHTNDHQLELARALEKEGKVIAVYEIENLAAAISAAHAFKPKVRGKSLLAERLYNYIKSLEVKK